MAIHPLKAARAAWQAAKPYMFGYHAVLDKHRRTAPRTRVQSEDKELDVTDRRKLIATTQEARRNFALAAWMIRHHLDFVSGFQFQALTPDEDFNRRLESLVRWRSRATNCDITGRHRLDRFVRLMESSRTVDGDVGVIMLRDGRLQAIEGDRIAKPTGGGLPGELRGVPLTHGIQLSKVGRPLRYCICNRKETGTESSAGGTDLVFSKLVPAKNFRLIGYFDRFDQWRGISPLASAVTTLQDTYETFEYVRIKQKLHALMGVFFKREVGAAGDGFNYTDPDTGDDTDGSTDRYEFDLKNGLIKVEGDPGDSVEMFESKTPSGEFISYSQLMVRIALLALDIPYTFYDAAGATYSAQRQNLITYMKSVRAKQADLREFLRDMSAWDIARWAKLPGDDGRPMLELPDVRVNGKSFTLKPREIEYEWISDGVPWIDPLKEVQADGLAVSYGFRTRDDVCRERYGTRYADVVDRLGKEEQSATIASATIAIGQPGQVTTRDEEKGNEANATDSGGQD